MALHSRLVLPDAALRPHCRLLLPDAALRLLCQQRPAQRLPAQRHPGSAASHPRRRPRPAIASRWHSATASRLASQQLCLGAHACNISADTAPPASNKPHSAERSTPVWLAIWRTWAGFANSQLRRATIRAPNNISAHPPCCHIGRCSDRANLSTHLHRLPTPPPYLRRMRLSPGRGAGVGCWIWL